MLKLNNKGISILEALITIAVLLMGVLVITRLFPVALQLGRSAEQATVATNLAQSKLEEMFYLNYDNIAIGTIEARQRMAIDMANPFYWYERETAVEYVDGNLNTSATETELKKITVHVYYKSSLLTINKDIELILLISKK